MSALDRLRWYRNRLASMSAAEVAHRLAEQGRRAWSRHRLPRLPDAAPDRLPALPGLPDALRAAPPDAGLLADWREVAARARSGRFRLLGVEWPAGGAGPAWHLDPVTGRSWPAGRYCFAIAHRHAPDMGDVKYVWELNRLQYLQPVAALAAAEGDGALAALAARHVESWIDANPPFLGVAWSSGIELALRVVSLLVVCAFLPAAFSPAQRRKLWRTLAAHGYWLRRFPSRFSSANNHAVAEAGGLYLLGALAPTLPGAAAWADFGRRRLLAEAQNQILADGVGAEQSPTYQAFTLEWLLLYAAVARRLGEEVPEALLGRLAAGAEFLTWISDEGGRTPRIGDDDEGRVLVSRTVEEDYVASVMAATAALTGRPLAAPPPAPHLRDLVFGRPQARAPAPLGVRRFAAGGCTVARAREADGRASLLVFDHGPLGYLSIAAHGHADALALWLHIGALPVLIDGGTYLYHSGGAWRDHFRGTAAHSTLVVEDCDSSRIAGAFNWARHAVAEVTDFGHDAAGWHVEARHDGYRRRFAVDHHRRVERQGRGPIIVTDWLAAARPGPAVARAVDIGFLVNPALSVILDGAAATVAGPAGPLLAIAHDGPLQAAVETGLEAPRRGWHSPAFGSRVPAPRLAYRGRLVPGVRCRFTLTLLPGG